LAPFGRSRVALDPAQLIEEVARRLPTIVWIFRETFRHDTIERRGRERADARNQRRLAVHDRADQACVALALERLPCREHLESHRSECEDVRACVCLPPFDLFRRHVLKRAQNRSLRRQVCGCRLPHRQIAGGDGGRRWLGKTEVEQLRAAFGQHHVAGFQIAVHNARAMRCVERLGDLNGDRHRVREGHGALFEPGRE
jgi:hypothetical protein